MAADTSANAKVPVYLALTKVYNRYMEWWMDRYIVRY